MGFITADRNQTILLGHCLDDFVEKDAKIRYITAVIDKLDLSKIYERYSPQGADSYEPKIMLAIIFFAFTESVYSTRKIEQYCKKHMDFIYASCNLKPDHTTIARFIQHNLDQMKDLFKQIILRAKQNGYADFKEIAIDGTKIRSSSSKKKSYQESKLERYMGAIQKEIDTYLEEFEKEQNLERKEEIDIKVKQLKDKKDLLEIRRNEVKQRKEKITKSYRESHQINIVEPEAFMMELGYGKGYSPAYNAQIGVDMGSQLITSPDVIQDRNDRQSFSTQHKNNEDTIGKPEEEERKYVTDNGYGSYEQLEYIKENNIDAYISFGSPSEEKGTSEDKVEEIKATGRRIKKEDFIYNKDNDTYKCPKGKELNFYRKENNKSFRGRKYRTKGCSDCELKLQCLASNNKKGKGEISCDEKEYLIDDMKAKIRQEEQAKVLFQKRKTSVEPVFGNIKANMKYDRFKRRGLAKVNGEFALVCLAHNLNKLFRIIRAKYPKLFFYFVSKGNIIHRLIVSFRATGIVRRYIPHNCLYA